MVGNICFNSPRSAPHDQDASGSKVGPNDDRNAEICAKHAPCMEYIFTYIYLNGWLKFMVNVGKNSICGVFGSLCTIQKFDIDSVL